MTKAKDTVVVACKLPHGLIIREERPHKEIELIMGGGTREITVWRPTGRSFVINGCAAEPGKMTMARDEAGRPYGPKSGKVAEVLQQGYALTHDVPAELWDHWLDTNKDQPMVKNGLIFAHKQLASVRSMAKDGDRQMSGLEGVDPDAPECDYRNPSMGIRRGETAAA